MSFLKFFTGAKAKEEKERERKARFDAQVVEAQDVLEQEQKDFLNTALECSIAEGCTSCRHYSEGGVIYYYDTEPTNFSDRSRIWYKEPGCKLWRSEK